MVHGHRGIYILFYIDLMIYISQHINMYTVIPAVNTRCGVHAVRTLQVNRTLLNEWVNECCLSVSVDVAHEDARRIVTLR